MAPMSTPSACSTRATRRPCTSAPSAVSPRLRRSSSPPAPTPPFSTTSSKPMPWAGRSTASSPPWPGSFAHTAQARKVRVEARARRGWCPACRLLVAWRLSRGRQGREHTGRRAHDRPPPRGQPHCRGHRTVQRGLSRPPGPPAFAPFRVRGFRFQWPADLATSCAFEMETLILGWYVLVETGSVVLLTVFGVLQFTGTLVAPMFGLMGDRVGHRNVLCMMRGIYTTLAAVLMISAFAGAPSPAFVLVMAGLNGLVRPSDLGVRMALAGDLL